MSKDRPVRNPKNWWIYWHSPRGQWEVFVRVRVGGLRKQVHVSFEDDLVTARIIRNQTLARLYCPLRRTVGGDVYRASEGALAKAWGELRTKRKTRLAQVMEDHPDPIEPPESGSLEIVPESGGDGALLDKLFGPGPGKGKERE